METPEIIEAHRRFRQEQGGSERSVAPPGGSGGPQRMRHVKFSACLDDQVALESNGQGDFTRHAASVLAQGVSGVTNEQFLKAVTADFGTGARQKPMLDCAAASRGLALLQPLQRR